MRRSLKAVGVAGMILDNKLERYRGNERADKRVEEILKQHQKEIASGKKPADEKADSGVAGLCPVPEISFRDRHCIRDLSIQSRRLLYSASEARILPEL